MINIKRQQPKIDEHTHKFVDCAVLIVSSSLFFFVFRKCGSKRLTNSEKKAHIRMKKNWMSKCLSVCILMVAAAFIFFSTNLLNIYYRQFVDVVAVCRCCWCFFFLLKHFFSSVFLLFFSSSKCTEPFTVHLFPLS